MRTTDLVILENGAANIVSVGHEMVQSRPIRTTIWFEAGKLDNIAIVVLEHFDDQVPTYTPWLDYQCPAVPHSLTAGQACGRLLPTELNTWPYVAVCDCQR